MVKRSTDQKLRLRNFDARYRRIEKGAVVKSHKEEQVSVTSGKRKANVRRETGAVSGMRVTIVHNKNPTMQTWVVSRL